MADKKISIIIPVYNVGTLISQCLESLARQCADEIEVVFVNDGSTDDTEARLQRFASESRIACKILSQKNSGVAAARNTGLSAASGEYLMFLDADDRLERNAVESVLKIIAATDADIIGWDWTNDHDGKLRPMHQADYHTPEEALANLMGGTMKWNLWLFAVKRELLTGNGVCFIPGADMGEDMMFMLKAFACAGTVARTNDALYVYNASNPASISNRMSERRRKEVETNLLAAADFLSHSRYADKCEEWLPHLKLYIKRPLLIGRSMADYKIWNAWFPEANQYATANHTLPFRTRLLQWMAARRLYVGVWLYNVIVYGLLYRLLYR